MKKGLKKALGLLVALSLMVVGSAFSALAADSPEQRQTFSVDLNNFDESQPYSETLHFEKDGQPVTVTLSYTPPLTRDPATPQNASDFHVPSVAGSRVKYLLCWRNG